MLTVPADRRGQLVDGGDHELLCLQDTELEVAVVKCGTMTDPDPEFERVSQLRTHFSIRLDSNMGTRRAQYYSLTGPSSRANESVACGVQCEELLTEYRQAARLVCCETPAVECQPGPVTPTNDVD